MLCYAVLQVLAHGKALLGYTVLGPVALLLVVEAVRVSGVLPGGHLIKTVTQSKWHRINLQVRAGKAGRLTGPAGKAGRRRGRGYEGEQAQQGSCWQLHMTARLHVQQQLICMCPLLSSCCPAATGARPHHTGSHQGRAGQGGRQDHQLPCGR